ncbi:DNA translocase FtsK-like [Dendroctonus ponderosae]|uniref:DNA translocase FtsK n=1 Tax=Dendroctonus ponderosae TaxID=77166 RepID=UPI0020360741|nr:DNA translocase FtsK [Dendroctonus ponderosae]XP_048523866.1 DNA translocase FtsK-like [Dendroctonus ponderosae]XP_048523911.1 DNA translocase FtsK-like [Dendroctonus ponderosae]KAH0998566.1 hypothetical protein HUJ05_013381 [Dendroctonus ponderosae]KAH0998576.1 hypothetical protein HUJ05_000013 [Dendroctonus ponderosae]KAH0998708.1 hypothetical protein HUJ05_009710 [Dendroctonus ponderosae]
MFVKLAVFVCFAGSVLAQHQSYQGPLAGGQPASLYPAGINPQSCPNYPDCSNPLVAISQNAAPQYQQSAPQYQQPAPQYQQPAPQYQQPAPQYPQYQAPVAATPAPVSQYNPVYPQQYAPAAQSQYSSDVQQRLDRGEYIGDGDYRGEGLAEALAPGYAGQAQAALVNQYNPAPAPQYNSAPAYQPAPQQYSAPAQPAQIPAGVNAQACPNYPFCHA